MWENIQETIQNYKALEIAGKKTTHLNHGVVRSKATPDKKRETDTLRVLARAEDQLRCSEWSPRDLFTDYRRIIGKVLI